MSSSFSKVVTIPNSLYQSQEGNYFVGQTPKLHLKNDHSYGGLLNPRKSGVNLFVNVFTITNFSKQPIVAEIWLDAKPQDKWRTSNHVKNTNMRISPSPCSPVKLIYHEHVKPLQGGVNVFDRVIPGNSTVVAEEDGKYILPPDSFFLLKLKSMSSDVVNAAIAFGWWIRRK